MASVAATAGVAWWVTVPLVGAGLSIVSMPEYVALWPRAREVGAELEWWKTIALSMFNNLACACGVASGRGLHALAMAVGDQSQRSG